MKNNNNIKEFDEIVGRKLKDYSEQPPRDLFARIEKTLGEKAAEAAPDASTTQAAPAKRRVIGIVYRYAAVAAVIAVAVLFTTRIWDRGPEAVIAPEVVAVNESTRSGIDNIQEYSPFATNESLAAGPAVIAGQVVKADMAGVGTSAAIARLEEVGIGLPVPSADRGTRIAAVSNKPATGADAELKRRMELDRQIQIENYWGDLFRDMDNSRPRRNSLLAASLYAGNLGAGSGNITSSDLASLASGNMLIKEGSNSIPSGVLTAPLSASGHGSEPAATLRHMMPFNFGVSLVFPVSDELSMVSGATYSYLYSYTRQQLLSTGGEGSVEQELHYVGIPVGVMYSFYRSRVVDFYLRGGGAIEKAVYSRRVIDRNLGGRPEISKMGVKGVQFSVDGALGADFRLTRGLGLYLETGAAYYFEDGNESTNFGKFTSYRTENPVNFMLRIGVRFNILR